MDKNKKCPVCGQVISSWTWSTSFNCRSCKTTLSFESFDDRSRPQKIVETAIGISYVLLLFFRQFYDINPLIIIVSAVLFLGLMLRGIYKNRSKVIVDSTIGYQKIITLNEKVRCLQKLLDSKIGPIDFLILEPDTKKKAGLDGLLSPLIKIHNERIGGLSIVEQNEAILQIKPDLNLMQLVSEEVKKLESEIKRLKSYLVEKS